jgi:hypothetical protein
MGKYVAQFKEWCYSIFIKGYDQTCKFNLIDIQNVKLEDRHIRLGYSRSDDSEGLCDAANDGEI